MDYKVTRHAPVERADDPKLVYLAIARHSDDEGRAEWTLEFWEQYGEGDSDLPFSSEAEAIAYAEAKFAVSPDGWRAGPQPFGPNAKS